jgi:hypothetical protein
VKNAIGITEPWRLYLDDIGSEVGEYRCGCWPGDKTRKVYYLQS